MGLILISIIVVFIMISLFSTEPPDLKRNKLVRNARVFVADNFDSGSGVIVDYQPYECVHPGGFFNNSLYKKEAWLVKLDGTESSRWFEYHQISIKE